MGTYERSGNPPVPSWWLEKVLPLLDDRSVNLSWLAKEASRHAGRKKAWTASAITKFKKDRVGATPALINGISAALRVPQPFFVAETEAAAVKMRTLQPPDEQETHPKTAQKVSQVESYLESSVRNAQDRTTDVLSEDALKATARRTVGRRARRTTGGR